MLRKVGVVLAVLGYAVLARGPLISLLHPGAAEHEMPGMTMPSTSTGADAWQAATLGALALFGIVLVLVPVRRGEKWALWTSLAAWGILATVRLYTDPRCLLVLNPHQHGCHTFMIALVLGVIGLGITGFAKTAKT